MKLDQKIGLLHAKGGGHTLLHTVMTVGELGGAALGYLGEKRVRGYPSYTPTATYTNMWFEQTTIANIFVGVFPHKCSSALYTYYQTLDGIELILHSSHK